MGGPETRDVIPQKTAHQDDLGEDGGLLPIEGELSIKKNLSSLHIDTRGSLYPCRKRHSSNVRAKAVTAFEAPVVICWSLPDRP
jgi:hypothetical protein